MRAELSRGDLMPIAVDIDVMLSPAQDVRGDGARRTRGHHPGEPGRPQEQAEAKAVRFTTLAALCEVLDCQPGDLLRYEPDHAVAEPATNSA
ncbi:hypothetical protein SALBM217S_03794 [Streptomyces griseoloalbus]